MSPTQKAAFAAASGIQPSALSFDIRLFVGGIALIFSLLVLAGLMHLLNSNSAWDKTIFGISIFGLAFTLMMIFIYIA